MTTAPDRRIRLKRALARLSVDRPPVIGTGGAIPSEIVAQSGYTLPAAHLQPEAMAGLALAAAYLTGFESAGVPLDATVEAEAFGAPIDLGDAQTEARILREPYDRSADVPRLPPERRLRLGRVAVTVAAVRQLAATAGDLPIIANLVGPVSVAASVVRPDALFRELRGRPAEVHDLLDHIAEFQLVFARQLADAGADVIVIHEDTATPALLGPAVFERIVVPYLHQLIIAVRETGVPVLLHVCGAINRVESALGRLHLDGFIPDAAVPLNHFARTFPHLAIVGNVSTFLLHQGHPQQIARIASQLADGSVHAIAPACGLSSATPLASIRALTAGDRPHE